MKANPPPTKQVSKFINLFLLIFSILLITNCKDRNEDVKSDCGCNSNVTHSIPESANLVGNIFYKTQLNPQDNYYNNTFWVSYTEPNCINCVHNMIICNEDLLSQEIINLKNTGESLSVKFAGDLKTICQKTFAPADYTYENITLTKIQKQ